MTSRRITGVVATPVMLLRIFTVSMERFNGCPESVAPAILSPAPALDSVRRRIRFRDGTGRERTPPYLRKCSSAEADPRSCRYAETFSAHQDGSRPAMRQIASVATALSLPMSGLISSSRVETASRLSA